jgi:hypothetical protein
MRIASSFLSLALLVFVAGAPVRADTALHLNELLPGPARDWDGSGAFSSRDDEWVEVVNTATDVLDVSSFYLTDGDSIPRFGFTGTLAPGEHRVIFGRESVDWERATGHPVFGFSLGNSGDAILLWQVVGADSMVVEEYHYTNHEAAADRAIGRAPDGTGPWALFDSLDPYSGTIAPLGTGCAPTPGQPNQCSTTPSRRVSWGDLKARYH